MAKQILTSHTQALGTIASRRRALKMSQAALAEKLGVSQSYLSAIELGKRTLTLERLIELLNVLGLDLVVQQRSTAASKADW